MNFKKITLYALVGVFGFFAIPALVRLATTTAIVRSRVDVAWPQGWDLREAPLPASYSGPRFAGSNLVARRMGAGGEVLAAISLNSLTHGADLATEMRAALDLLRQGYTTRNLTANCAEPAGTTLGTLAALESICRVGKGETVLLEQIVVMAVDATYVHSFGYTAQPGDFAADLETFKAVRASLRFE